ncbi:hypothetical protein L3Q82_003627 [Scortum barcoo]|uniref:Uncharacterized protein n=1 Tax=Scortum barcoo TaxID=214431 RepID=A0ACB8VNK6_9TELE|nr:hypothetical protein L3Q82_003627 [Scortum barcoo]
MAKNQEVERIAKKLDKMVHKKNTCTAEPDDECHSTPGMFKGEMMATNDVGDVKGERYASATVVTRRAFGAGGVTVWAGVSSQYRTALHFVNGTVTSPYYLNNIINPVIVPLNEQHSPNFIFMDDNAPAHRGRISREWLLETGVPRMEWPALSPNLNPIENLFYGIS